jgi:hypothetical protein
MAEALRCDVLKAPAAHATACSAPSATPAAAVHLRGHHGRWVTAAPDMLMPDASQATEHGSADAEADVAAPGSSASLHRSSSTPGQLGSDGSVQCAGAPVLHGHAPGAGVVGAKPGSGSELAAGEVFTGKVSAGPEGPMQVQGSESSGAITGRACNLHVHASK